MFNIIETLGIYFTCELLPNSLGSEVALHFNVSYWQLYLVVSSVQRKFFAGQCGPCVNLSTLKQDHINSLDLMPIHHRKAAVPTSQYPETQSFGAQVFLPFQSKWSGRICINWKLCKYLNTAIAIDIVQHMFGCIAKSAVYHNRES